MTLSRLGREADNVPAGQASAGSSVRFARDGSRMWWGGEDTPGPPAVLPEGFCRSPHGGGFSFAAGPLRDDRLSGQRRSDTRNRRAKRVSPAWRESAHVSGDTAGGGRRMGRISAGAPICRPTHLFTPCGIPPRPIATGWAARRKRRRTPPRPHSRPRPSPSRAQAVGAGTLGSCSRSPPPSANRRSARRRMAFGSIGSTSTGDSPGPDLSGVFLPGAADWMRIRPDGMAIVDARACLETPNRRAHRSRLRRAARPRRRRLRPRASRGFP